MPEIRADLAQYYRVKAMFESVLGRNAFMRVKDCGALSEWRDNYIRLLKAVDVASQATVEVCDVEWRNELKELLAHGIKSLSTVKTIDELHADVAATLGELAFLQLGFVPRKHYLLENVPLTARNWKLNPVRSIQYVQNAEQRTLQNRLSESKNSSK